MFLARAGAAGDRHPPAPQCAVLRAAARGPTRDRQARGRALPRDRGNALRASGNLPEKRPGRTGGRRRHGRLPLVRRRGGASGRCGRSGCSAPGSSASAAEAARLAPGTAAIAGGSARRVRPAGTSMPARIPAGDERELPAAGGAGQKKPPEGGPRKRGNVFDGDGTTNGGRWNSR